VIGVHRVGQGDSSEYFREVFAMSSLVDRGLVEEEEEQLQPLTTVRRPYANAPSMHSP
jgi:hypothetical protein